MPPSTNNLGAIMDTVDKAGMVESAPVKKRGRPKKVQTEQTESQDPVAPHHKIRMQDAQKYRSREENAVLEKWYEIRGHKLSLCKKSKGGGTYRTYVGSTNDKERGGQLMAFVKKLEKEGRLKKVL